MRAAETIFLVRKQTEADLLRELGGGGRDSARRLIVQIIGQPNALTYETLRRLRRSPEAAKRRTPVVVWAPDGDSAERWRAAGALALTGKLTLAGADKALDAARSVPWVETTVYVGPDRRFKRTWLKREVRRLADTHVGAQPDRAAADGSSFDTRLRQLRFAAFGLDKADRERRAQFLADARSAVRAAEAARRMHAAAAMDSLVRYLSARGANGALDSELIERHLQAGEAGAAEAAALIPRLQRSVDRAIGLA